MTKSGGSTLVGLAACGGGNNAPVVTPPAPPLLFAPFQAASQVIGQADFVSGAENRGGPVGANTLSDTAGTLVVNGQLYIADSGALRVVRYDATTPNVGASATLALGANSPAVIGTGGVTATSLNGPVRVASDGTRLAVADLADARVLIWNTIPTTDEAAADVVVGKPDFATNGPTAGSTGLAGCWGVAFAGGKLIVADTDNHRVLIWNSVPATNGTAADRRLVGLHAADRH